MIGHRQGYWIAKTQCAFVILSSPKSKALKWRCAHIVHIIHGGLSTIITLKLNINRTRFNQNPSTVILTWSDKLDRFQFSFSVLVVFTSHHYCLFSSRVIRSDFSALESIWKYIFFQIIFETEKIFWSKSNFLNS